MRITEIVIEQQLDEGPKLDKFGRAVGNFAGGVAKGLGAVAGGVVGAGSALAKGYRAGKDIVSKGGNAPADDAPTAPADTSKTTPPGDTTTPPADTTTTPPADTSKTTPPADTTPSPAPAPAPAPQKTDDVMATVKSQVDKLDPAGKKELLTMLQKSVQQPAPAPADDAKARIDANPQGFDPNTGKPNPVPNNTAPSGGGTTPPGGKSAAPQNKAASDTFEKAKGDIRKVQSGTKPLPDQMAQGIQADIAKMAKGDKESGVAAAQKIMQFAQRGMDIAALQQAWSANAKAGERFLSQSVYRDITNMLREHGLIWSDLNLRVRIDESVGKGVFIRYAKPVVESVQLFRIK